MSTQYELHTPIQVIKHLWPEELEPKVTIDCNTYMHAPFIRDAIEGFLMQETTFKVEILIRDDASTDGTAEIVKEYEAKHHQLIRATYQVENQYKKNPKTPKFVKPPPRRGKYIAICEGDDYWTDPLKLQKQVVFLEANPDYSLTCGGFLSVDVNTNSRKEIIKFKSTHEANGYTFTLGEMSQGWITKTLTLVYRAHARNPDDFKNYKYSRDIHTFYHLLKAGKGYYFNEIFGVYRIHSGGIFSSKSKVEKLEIRYKIYRELFMSNKDETSRSLFFNATLSLLVYNSLRFFKGSTIVGNLELLSSCAKTFKFKKDLHRFFKNPRRVFNTILNK